MAKIKGKFEYKKEKDKKKDKHKLRELKEKKERKKDRKLRKQCECNHLDAKHNKAHMKKVYIKDADGKDVLMYNQCKICGGKMYARPDQFLTKDAIESAQETLYTAWSLIRNKYVIKSDFDKNITNALYMNSRVGTIIEKLKDADIEKKTKKNKKKNKGKGKKNKKSYRVNY